MGDSPNQVVPPKSMKNFIAFTGNASSNGKFQAASVHPEYGELPKQGYVQLINNRTNFNPSTGEIYGESTTSFLIVGKRDQADKVVNINQGDTVTVEGKITENRKLDDAGKYVSSTYAIVCSKVEVVSSKRARDLTRLAIAQAKAKPQAEVQA